MEDVVKFTPFSSRIKAIFGLVAVSFNRFVCSIDERLEREADFTFATQRYLAPEVANDTLMKSSFTALKMVDIYSLGLVFYEICQ